MRAPERISAAYRRDVVAKVGGAARRMIGVAQRKNPRHLRDVRAELHRHAGDFAGGGMLAMRFQRRVGMRRGARELFSTNYAHDRTSAISIRADSHGSPSVISKKAARRSA